MSELLLELFSEEIPARMQEEARRELARRLERELAERALDFGAIRSFATPRRLVAVVEGLASRQRDREVERRGPRADAPERARQGFLRSLEGSSYRLEEREERRGRFLYAVVHEPGRPCREVLLDLLPELIARFPWPKSMRWGAGEMRWVRPLHALLCLLDGEPVPVRVGGLVAGDRTFGHRFHAPGPIRVAGFADYRERLRRAFVVLDGEERRRRILEQAHAALRPLDLRLEEDEDLLAELAGLVEWPVVLVGEIDPAFMGLPPEVLVTAMRHHQRYLAVRDAAGALAPRFVMVANIQARDGGRAIVAGNERVLRARLWDARYFWEQDRRVPLESLLPRLARLIFHARLGSMAEKAERLERLAAAVAERLPGVSPELAARAGRLCKCDLVSGMVGEFPELQGVMGGYYAREQGEPEEVAQAIAEHYRPAGADDRCPEAPVSIALALADRIDTLVGFFAAGIRPSGSKDPFALRRAALGVIRLVVDHGLRLRLGELFKAALDGYGERFASLDRGKLAAELLDFLSERLRVELRVQGVRADLIRAVFAVGGEDDLLRLLARVRALSDFLASEAGADLLTAYRRSRNIVAIEERRDGRSYRGEPDPERFALAEETGLYEALVRARAVIEERLLAEDFAGAMAALAELRGPVDAFFERVRVNAPDSALRANRLYILDALRAVFETIADFSLVEAAGDAEGGVER